MPHYETELAEQCYSLEKVEPANGKQKLVRVNGSSSQWGSAVYYSCISFYMVLVNMLFYCYISRMFMRAVL